MGNRFLQPMAGCNRNKVAILTGFAGLDTSGDVLAASPGVTEISSFGTLTHTGTGTYTFTLSDQYARILFAQVELILSVAGSERNIEARVAAVPGTGGVAAGKEIKIITREAGSTASLVNNATENKTLQILILATESGVNR